MAGGFSDFRNADLSDRGVYGRSDRGGHDDRRSGPRTPEFARHAAEAIPAGLDVPNEPAHPNFLVVDFGICEEDGRLDAAIDRVAGVPQPLRPSNCFFCGCLRKTFPVIPRNWTSSFGGMKDDAYLELLRSVIIWGLESGERDFARDRTGETKDADRFCLHGDVPRRSPGLLDAGFESAARSSFMIAMAAKCGSSGFTIASFSMS